MTVRRTSLTPDAGLRLLRVIRWLLPLALAAVALLFELNEHFTEGAAAVEPWFYAEVLLFALVGPIAVFVTLLWVERLVTAYYETSAELAAVNRDLETRIDERTAHLAEATEQLRAANIELARANEELRQLDRLKSEFVSLVSHQLRAPLTNINGALEIVSQDGESLPDDTQKTLRILVHEGQRLSWLIQTILDVSRIEAGRLQPRLGPVAVGPLLAEACAATLGAEPGQSHELVVAEGLPPVWADETLLGEVVRNLIENAMRYSAADAPVDVTAGLTDRGVEVAISDHGEGVPAEEQERIFQSFHRASSDEGSVKGSGLGLYFADRLVEAMGGSIRVESPIWPSDEAPGARFIVLVPVAEDDPEAASAVEDDALLVTT